MRSLRLLKIAALLASGCALAAEVPVEFHLADETGLSQTQQRALTAEYSAWAQRIYSYLHVAQPAPVNVVISRHAHVGMYVDDKLYMPADDHDEMLETFIHELSHQATGHDSSFFYKEGIATHTLEALYAQDKKIPQGWPQYGEACDAWIALFAARGQLLSLREALDWPGYDGKNPEGDYRSWQIYLMGGSFAGWYIATYGYDAYKRAFDTQQLPEAAEKLQRRWLASIKAKSWAPFDAAQALPQGPRYQGFSNRLK